MTETLNVLVIGLIAAATGELLRYVTGNLKLNPMAKKVYQLSEDIKVIKEQVETNGGNSLKDIILKLKKEIELHNIVQEQRWKIALDRLDTPIYFSDLEGNCIFVNLALAKLFRVHREDMFQNGWLNRIKNKPQAFNNWKEAIQKGIEYSDEYELVDDNGKVYAKCSTKAHLVKGGNIPLFYYGEIHEINHVDK